MHGFFNLNKPEGMSSAKAVAIVKALLNVKKVGHTGTLDPLACGVLPLALGEATKLSQYIMADRKAYRFTVQWGRATTTDDREGETLAESPKRPSEQEIRAILPQFIGNIMQRPPDFSAIQVAGKRSYETARAGGKVELPPRPVEVYRLEIEECSTDRTTFFVECGKGTYVRSLARDMGEALGCFGHVTFLQRRQVGIFSLENAVSLDFCEKNRYSLPPDFGLIPMDTPLDDILAVSFGADQLHRLKQGQSASPLAAAREFCEAPLLRCYDAKSADFVGLGRPAGSLVKPVKVFNL